MEKKTLGGFLSALRKADGMTQRELAEKLNVSDKAVSRWERDESAPDLTLIPVIAEIFGVTSDELLRGQRCTDRTDPERSAAKVEKQLRHLLKDTETKFYIRSAVAATVAFVGLIAAAIGNSGFLRALIGFWAGCIFFVAALVCEVIFLFLGLSTLDSTDFDSSQLSATRKRLIVGAEYVVGGILALFSFCLPLVIFVPDPYMGMQASSWIPRGFLFAAAVALAVLAVSCLINIRLGIQATPDTKSPQGKLRLRCAKIAVVVLLILGVGHLVLAGFLSSNPQIAGRSHRFDTLEEFKIFMETPVSYNGDPLSIVDVTSDHGEITYIYKDAEGNLYEFLKESVLTEIHAHLNDTEPLLTYRHLNQAATYINYGPASNDLLPIHVMSSSQFRQANRRCELICLAYCITYLATAIILRGYYRKRKGLL